MKLKWYGHSCFGLTFANGTTIVMAINFEPRAMECPVKVNGTVGRVWRGAVKDGKISLDANEVALFEVK